MKISPEMYLWIKKSSLYFGSPQDMDPDLGNFEGIFSLPLWDKGNLAHLANIPRSCQQLLMNFLGWDISFATNHAIFVFIRTKIRIEEFLAEFLLHDADMHSAYLPRRRGFLSVTSWYCIKTAKPI